MTTITTTNFAIYDVLNELHEPEHHWLLEAQAEFTVEMSYVTKYSCTVDHENSASTTTRNTARTVSVTFEDDAIAVQFKLKYQDKL